MELAENPVEDIVSEVLGNHYVTFDSEADSKLVAHIVALLEDSTKRGVNVGSGFESNAAYEIRIVLLQTFTRGVSSVKTVIEIFDKLERSNELGWLVE
jgi:hypothetical protein